MLVVKEGTSSILVSMESVGNAGNSPHHMESHNTVAAWAEENGWKHPFARTGLVFEVEQPLQMIHLPTEEKLFEQAFGAACTKWPVSSIMEYLHDYGMTKIESNCNNMLASSIRDAEVRITLDATRKTAIAGLLAILERSEFEYSLEMDQGSLGTIVVRIFRRCEECKVDPPDVIKNIEQFEINEYVYDLETDNHHFCGGLGNVLLHNTDSLFLKGPTREQIQSTVNWAKEEFGVDLDLDKEYRYVVFSTRKKNYLGVQKDGKVDVKGLTGKKSHTPPFIRNLFYEILDILSSVKSEEEFAQSKQKIGDMISQYAKKLKARQIPLTDLAFNVMISKAPSEYVKTVPQHIRAAKLLESTREIKKGDIISYVKIINKPGVKPVEMARPDEIDSAKYVEFMESTFDQILSSMDLDFNTLIGAPKQTGLDQFFWN
ncbi:MAG: hypothetical protein KGI33_02990 [Thaumarchaeota archaeon]|nr:hypothetical protein [Nitrososphaerota archaeon]